MFNMSTVPVLATHLYAQVYVLRFGAEVLLDYEYSTRHHSALTLQQD